MNMSVYEITWHFIAGLLYGMVLCYLLQLLSQMILLLMEGLIHCIVTKLMI